MHPSTIATFNHLEQVDWFSRVGCADFDDITMLSSWEEAIEMCAGIEWENIQLHAANQLTIKLHFEAMDEYRRWNDIVKDIKPFICDFVARKINLVVREHHLPKVFEDSINWDMINLAMECEYSDIIKPSFFAGNSFWYAKGHFPCGWKGSFPGGHPVIY